MSQRVTISKQELTQDSFAEQLQADVDGVLSLIADEFREEQPRRRPLSELLDSVRAKLTGIVDSVIEHDELEHLPRPTRHTGFGTSARMLTDAFHDTHEGAALLDPSGIILQANAAFLAMATSESHALVGESLADALQFEIDDFQRILARVATGIPWSGRARARSESDRSYWISLSFVSQLNCSSPHIVALISDISDYAGTEKRLRQQAMHDKLTGLPNRRFFCDRLDTLLGELRQSGRGADVCFIDLDDFKNINDFAGHANGDMLLRTVGALIQQTLGEQAFVARFGGDEFAVVLPDRDDLGKDSLTPYERLLTAFREPFPLHDAEALISTSIGVARFPDHAQDIDALLSAADAAMYAAKAAGKNQVRMYSAALQADRVERQRIQSKLRHALKDGEIELWFQPKVDAKTSVPVGCEALARWKTASGEYIPPSRFVPIAEQTGLIYSLGNKVFQLAAHTACHWRTLDLHPNIAVNVSPQQLRHPRFIEQLNEILATTGAQAEWFELEITENAVMDNVEHAVRMIDHLGALGFRIAIDDFGTGYSSLGYLKTFNIHTLKIDLSFVRDVMRDHQSNAIVRSIISLGSGLNLTLVAEGVETTQQANFLTEAGCDFLQGYLFGKPEPAPQYVQWLLTHATSQAAIL